MPNDISIMHNLALLTYTKTQTPCNTLIFNHVQKQAQIFALILHAASEFQSLYQTVFVCDSLLEMANLELVDFKLLLQV